MSLPKRIDLFFVPERVPVAAQIVTLTAPRIRRRMGDAWWDDPAIDPELAATEIDRDWSWQALRIERGASVLRSRRIAVITGEGAVQGAAMYSTEPVDCVLEPEHAALFVELLFTAPSNRPWIRTDRAERFRGVGLELLIAMAEESRDRGCGGGLKLESSPGFVEWYVKRGLRVTPENPILHEGVTYTPMELTAGAASALLADE